MTLIVGRILNNNFHIHSDTRLTNPLVKKGPLSGALKILILAPRVCVCWSGQIEFATTFVEAFFQNNCWTIGGLKSLLLDVHKNSEERTCFGIAAFVCNQAQFYSITNGKISGPQSTFWLGEQDGLEKYQEYFSQTNHDKPVSARMYDAFDSVVKYSNHPTIGDHHIYAYTNQNDLQCAEGSVFVYHVKLSNEARIDPNQFGAELRAASMGTPYTGSHGIAYLTTVCAEYFGMAIHYLHGNFGLFYCPKLAPSSGRSRLEANRFLNLNCHAFIATIKRDFGIPMRGLVRFDDSAAQYVDSTNWNAEECTQFIEKGTNPSPHHDLDTTQSTMQVSFDVTQDIQD